MILSDTEIKKEIELGNITVSGWEGELYIGPSSLDLHLDNKAIIIPALDKYSDGYRAFSLQDDMSILYTKHDDWDDIQINPGDFMLLSTKERIKFPNNISGFVQGRSSIARAGLQIHAAGFVDPGFEGTITLEVTNMTQVPLIVPKDIRICQMVFARSSEISSVAYSHKADSKYQGQSGPVVSKIKEELV